MKKKKESLSSNFVLWQLLHRTFHATIKVRQKELHSDGLTVRQSAVLRAVLYLGSKATPSRLSKHLFLELNTVSEQLKRMEADGLISKVKSSERKNFTRIEVTEKGYQLHLKTQSGRSIDDIMTMLTKKERSELWSTLSKIRNQAVKLLGMDDNDLYPPPDSPEF